MAKKRKSKKISSKSKISKISSNNEMLNLLKLVLVISAIVVIFYFITIFVNKKEEQLPVEKVEQPAEIQYDNILVGNVLTQPNDSYYVLAKMQDDKNASIYEVYLSKYIALKDSLRVYYVDLDNPLNSNYVSESSNFKIKKITDIKFKETTLLLVQNGKIKKTYEGKENITKILLDIAKIEETDK